MKIAESAIQLTSSHTAEESLQRQESLTFWQNNRNKETVSAQGHSPHDRHLKDQAQRLAAAAAKVSLSPAAMEKAAQTAGTAAAETPDDQADSITDLNMQILKALFEKMTGRKMRLFDYRNLMARARAADQAVPIAESGGAAQGGAQAAPQGWGLVYEHHERYSESETTHFAAQGVVRTTDGQEIQIAIDLTMSRAFTSQVDESLRMGDALLKDPLVINFNGSAAQLTRDTFSFDINADGTNDQIAFVTPGSGLLALDRNQDGIINDGSELFGAVSGDGFADLAAYDSDGNGWIDENDEIFSRLRVWKKSVDGTDQLASLGEQGVGALYLGRVATPFSLKDSGNQLQGQVQSTGLFLGEQGGAGTLQQLDLVA